jgi:hypothetical protein
VRLPRSPRRAVKLVAPPVEIDPDQIAHGERIDDAILRLGAAACARRAARAVGEEAKRRTNGPTGWPKWVQIGEKILGDQSILGPLAVPRGVEPLFSG